MIGIPNPRIARFLVPISALLILGGVAIWWQAAGGWSRVQAREKISLVNQMGREINLLVEVADTPEKQSLGLMHRLSLKEGTGMLFVFDEPRERSFWMKNTLIPLDILFFDEEGAFVSRLTMLPCFEDPCPTYVSGGPAMYAFEVNRDEPLTREVGEGWKLLRGGQN